MHALTTTTQPSAARSKCQGRVDGNLIKTRVKEGDNVRTGDVLFVISGEREIEVRGERRETQAMIARELSRSSEIAGRDALLSTQRARERLTSLAARVTAKARR